MVSATAINSFGTSTLSRLPTECRMEVYRQLFAGSKLKLDWHARQALLTKKIDGDKLRLLSFFVDRSWLAILFTCQAILDEAIEFLASTTTLIIHDSFQREDTSAFLPSWFLSYVPSLEIDLGAFVHVSRKQMANLKTVTLLQEVEGIAGGGDAYHILVCSNCGTPDAHLFICEVMEDVVDWEWKKKQIQHLSKEEGWQVTLSARIDQGLPSDTYLEVSVSIETMKPIRKQGVFAGRALELGDWYEEYQSHHHKTDDPYDDC